MINVRQVANKMLTLGTPESIPLPRNHAFRSLLLRLAGSVSISSVTTAGNVHNEGLARCLSSVEIKRGNDTVFSLPGFLIYQLNKLMHKADPAITKLANASAQSNVALSNLLEIDFQNCLGVKEFDTLLRGAGLSSLDLFVNTVAIDNILYGNTSTVAEGTTKASLEVTAVEERGVNDFAFGDVKVSLLRKAKIDGASTSFQIESLPIGNNYKGFMLFFEDGKAPSDALLNRLSLKSGSESFFSNVEAKTLKDYAKTRFQQANMSAGVYYLDCMPDGRLNQTIKTGMANNGRGTMEFLLDVDAPSSDAYVYVVGLQYVEPVKVVKD